MEKTLSELLPHHTELLAAFRPPHSQLGYIPRQWLAFQVYSSTPLGIEGQTPPYRSVQILNWLQMGIPHILPEEVMKIVVRDNRDERLALTLLARLIILALRVTMLDAVAQKSHIQLLIASDAHCTLKPAFMTYWQMLWKSFATEQAQTLSCTFTNLNEHQPHITYDAAIFVTHNEEWPIYIADWLAYANTPVQVISRSTPTIATQRTFWPTTHDASLYTKNLHTLVSHISNTNCQLPISYPQGGVMSIAPLSDFLTQLLYTTIPLAEQTLLVLPHEVALSAARIQLYTLGIDAICSLGHFTQTQDWLSKWRGVLHRQRLIILCTTSQLLHPFWHECAQVWQPRHIVYSAAEHLSPWHNPSHALEVARWTRLRQLFPTTTYWYQANALRTTDLDALRELLPITHTLGNTCDPLSLKQTEHPWCQTVFVDRSTTHTHQGFHISKLRHLEACLANDTTQPIALFCPHTKGQLGVSDGVYMGVTTRLTTLPRFTNAPPICQAIDTEHSYAIDSLYQGKAHAAVAFSPLQSYILPYASSVYYLSLPNSICDLISLQTSQRPITFLLANTMEEELALLRFRLEGSFVGVDREFSCAMLVLNAIVQGATLSLAYPSLLSDYLDQALIQLGKPVIAQHHAEQDKPQRYQYIILQALATLQATGCIQTFSYCLDKQLLEATPSPDVDTYRLKQYIEQRYATYYPAYLTEFDTIAQHLYAQHHTHRTTNLQVPHKEKQSYFNRLILWIKTLLTAFRRD